MVTYTAYPLGRIPMELQRQEPYIIRDMGYKWTDAREIIDIFERKVAKFAGAKYAVAVDCCTHAIELSFRYLFSTGELKIGDTVYIPENTYISAALVPIQLGLSAQFKKLFWTGSYRYGNTRIVDAAVSWQKDMYVYISTLFCLSFQIKKRLPIGRGGMILTDDKDAYDWLRFARYDGRDLSTPYDSRGHVKMQGWHYYMTPEDAARGIILMDAIKEEGDSANWTNYPNIKEMLNL